MPPSHPAIGSAFTLLELVIVMAILSLIVLVSSQAIDSGMRMNDRIALQADLNGRADAALNALAIELRTVDDDPANLKVANTGFTSTAASDVYTYRLDQGIRRPAGQRASGAAGGPARFETFRTGWEPGCHRLEYLKDDGSGLVYHAPDGSVLPPTGTLTRYTYSDPAGTVLTRTEVITDRIRKDGFSITRVGNTLRLALTLQAPFQNGVQSVLVEAADAEVLFLRSSMFAGPRSSDGAPRAAAAEAVASPREAGEPAISTIGTASDDTGWPLISIGPRLDILAGGRQQIAIHIAAPVGATVKPAFTGFAIIAHPSSVTPGSRREIAIGEPIDIVGGTLEHLVLANVTPTGRDGVTSTDGTYTYTISGTMTGPLSVEVSASTGSATVGNRVKTREF